MKIRPLLRTMKLGEDVAENDSRLDDYFVETSAFLDLVDDEADLILGPKGSGKSALSRRLADPDVPIPGLDDVDIVPAFNIHGSVIFRRLATDLESLDEGTMRTAWLAYVLSLVGNHLLDKYPDDPNGPALDRRLTAAGLRVTEGRPKASWSVVLDALRRTSTPTRDAQDVSWSRSSGPVLGAGLSFHPTDLGEAPPSGPRPNAISDFELEDLLSEVVAALRRLNKRCWVVFDRLDEAFQHKRDFEKTALRALLRAHLDITSFGTELRTKLFLRTDILSRITEDDGFVNATHVRTLRLSWDHKTIIHLVARRIYENSDIRHEFGWTEQMMSTDTDRLNICTRVLPPTLDSQDIFGWLVQWTTDAHNEPNPRNVLTLLREARAAQLRVCDRDDPDLVPGGSLLASKAIVEGFRKLSRIRLDDTLIAEFNELRPMLERLKGRSFTFTANELSRILKTANDLETRKVITLLKYAGVLRESGNGQFSVPLLYRWALNMQQRRPQQASGSKSKSRANISGETSGTLSLPYLEDLGGRSSPPRQPESQIGSGRSISRKQSARASGAGSMKSVAADVGAKGPRERRRRRRAALPVDTPAPSPHARETGSTKGQDARHANDVISGVTGQSRAPASGASGVKAGEGQTAGRRRRATAPGGPPRYEAEDDKQIGTP